MTIDINYSQDTIVSTDYNIELVSALINAYNEANGAFNRANNITGIPFSDTITATGGLAVNAGSYLLIAGNGTFALTANAATTSAPGVIQITDGVLSTSTTTAATPNAVNVVMNQASAAFNEANSFQSIINSAFTLANTDATNITIHNGVNLSQNANIAAVFSSYNAYTVTANSIFLNATTDDYTSGTLTVSSLTANLGINIATVVANSTITATGNITGGNIVTPGVVNSKSVMVNTVNVGGTYVLSQNDSGMVIVYNNAAPLTVNTSMLNTAPGSYGSGYVGFRTVVTQINTGMVTIQAGPNTVLLPRVAGNNAIAQQNASISLFVWSSNTFLLDGAIAGGLNPASLNDTVTGLGITTQAATANSVATVFSSYNSYTATANAIFLGTATDDVTSGTLTVKSLTANLGINVATVVANSTITATGNITGGNLNTTGVVNSQITSISTITTATNYILSLRDSGQIITYSNTVNLNVNIGSPTALPAGFRVIFIQANTGNVTFLANGVNLFSRIGVSMKTLGQYGMATVFCYSSNNYILSGEIS